MVQNYDCFPLKKYDIEEVFSLIFRLYAFWIVLLLVLCLAVVALGFLV